MASKSPYIIGHNSHQYEVVKGWRDLNVNTHPVADCHEMVIDKSGWIFLLTNEIRNNILIYNPTETAIAPNGDIYVTDGYGLQFLMKTMKFRLQ